MLKNALIFAAALVTANSFVSAADAGGCGGREFFQRNYYSYQSYPDRSYVRAERRSKRAVLSQARVKANAKAAANARQIAAKKAAAPSTDVALAETPVAKIKDVTIPFVKKADLETPVAPVKTASTPDVCRKFSATVGGLIDTPCE